MKIKNVLQKLISITLVFGFIAPSIFIVGTSGLQIVEAQNTIDLGPDPGLKNASAEYEANIRKIQAAHILQQQSQRQADNNILFGRGAIFDSQRAYDNAQASIAADQQSQQQAAALAGLPVAGQAANTQGGGAGSQTAQQLLSCSASSILATLLQQVIGNLIGNALGGLFGGLISPEVQVADNTVRAKQTGRTILGIPILPSWDAVANCLMNMIIGYIGQSAVQFANTGLQGNPVFPKSLSGLAQGILDNETAILLNYIGKGGKNGQPAVCSAYAKPIQQSILSNAVQTYPQQATCGFTDPGGGTLSQFTSGQSPNSQNFLGNFLQLATNNIFTQTQLANQHLQSQQTARLSNISSQLNYGSGVLPTVDNKGNTVVPASFVASEINKRTGGPLQKLFNSESVNSLVQTLLNAAFQVGINELFKQKNTSSSTNVKNTTSTGSRTTGSSSSSSGTTNTTSLGSNLFGGVKSAVGGAVGDAVGGAVGDAVGGIVGGAAGGILGGIGGLLGGDGSVGGRIGGRIGQTVGGAVGDVAGGTIKSAVGGAGGGAAGGTIKSAVSGAVGDVVGGVGSNLLEGAQSAVGGAVNNSSSSTSALSVSCSANPSTVKEREKTTWTASASGGKAPYSYNWSPGGNSQSDTTSYSNDKTYERSVTVKDSSGKQSTAQCLVTVIDRK